MPTAAVASVAAAAAATLGCAFAVWRQRRGTAPPDGKGGKRRTRRKRTSSEASKLVKVAAHRKGWWLEGSYRPLTLHVPCGAGDGSNARFVLLLDPALPPSCEEDLRHDLAQVAAKMPPHALQKVADACHIYVNLDNGRRGAEVHWCPKTFLPRGASPKSSSAPRGFLARLGDDDPAKDESSAEEVESDEEDVLEQRTLAVEINNWKDYGRFMLNREGVLLHELSHVFNGTIGRDHAGIVGMYAAAKHSGKYERVARKDGSKARAYGLKNHLEFFASLSVAMLGGSNDYYPFTRQELRKFDELSFGALLAIWSQYGDDVTSWAIGENGQ
eukprot:TRINITY_DN23404_c0_g1_i1.p1 TRINITY_DN23404_c0_g1~~TRINITY_DN23404_c0_g1_i1.p1  ORF type:complete len:354 (+),score=79.30 TRINITY_DN23404_c0_g1_i1:77-1063(+)